MKVLRTNWAIDIADEIKRTNRHCRGLARNKPVACVNMMPRTIDNCVRTPKVNVCLSLPTSHGKYVGVPTLPLILEGAISDRYMGPTQIPRPAPIPTSVLFDIFQRTIQ